MSCANEEMQPNILPKTSQEKEILNIGILAPGGAVFNYKHITKTKEFLQNEGFDVTLGETLKSNFGYFSANDETRAKEINRFFEDKNIDIIICARGGWGCNRIIPYLDLDIIRQNPKPLVGFSDITTLLNYIHFKTGMITYHGNMAYSSWGNYSYQSFDNTIVKQTTNKIVNHPSFQRKNISKPTVISAKGKLIGGNLTVLTSMIGTEYEPVWKNNILCLEDTHEEPYKIDRMLLQLRDNGVFNQLAGIIIGQFNKCEAENPEQSFTLDEVFTQYFSELPIPVISNCSFGHVVHKFSIPIGQMAEINVENQSISLIY